MGAKAGEVADHLLLAIVTAEFALFDVVFVRDVNI